MSVAVSINQRTTLIHDALDAYLTFGHALHRANMSAWLRLDFSLVELKALITIAQNDRLTISGLAVHLQASRPEASRTTDQLYRRGLITRVEDRADRRRCLLGLTPTGHDWYTALLFGDRTALAGAVARLEWAELQQLVQGLRALLVRPPVVTVLPEFVEEVPAEPGPTR